MGAWIVKGKPSRSDLSRMLVSGRRERWVTRKPPRGWAAGDVVFMWKGAPALCVLGLAKIMSIRAPNAAGDSYFVLEYATAPFENPVGIHELRRDPVLGDASFLKAGAAGTLFALSDEQAAQLDLLVRRANGSGLKPAKKPAPQEVRRSDRRKPPRRAPASAGDAARPEAEPELALSIRQPWAELIMRGIKTIEVRPLLTHKRARVHIYAGQKRAHPDDEARVKRDYGLDVEALPRGVLVGSVDIVDCRRVRPSDSAAAAFAIGARDSSFGWRLANPKRAKRLLVPKGQPQPMFFRPF